jgi:endoglucanase
MPVRTGFLVLLLAFVLPLTAQNRVAAPDRVADLETAFTRAQHLRHGINASGWFAQSPHDYSAAHTDAYIDAQDIALIAHMGFDYVRLSIDPTPLESSLHGYGANADFLARLDKAVDTILANGLAVFIDIHSPQWAEQLRTGNDIDRFVSLWRQLAAHYANRDPNLLFFEILNEPEMNDRYAWEGVQLRLAAAIREAAPRHTIIATGANWSDIPDLVSLHPMADGNVIYNFHFYEPHEFTHQGATWGTWWWRYTHDIPYPPTDASMEPSLRQVPDWVARVELKNNYFLSSWDARRIRMMIDEAGSWARENHVPLICNEFGVFRDHSDPVSRANWIRDVRTALEANGIGWAMWDYRGNFGVVHKENGQPAKVDENIAEALGLKGK